jgi:hypothetical protein
VFVPLTLGQGRKARNVDEGKAAMHPHRLTVPRFPRRYGASSDWRVNPCRLPHCDRSPMVRVRSLPEPVYYTSDHM